MRRLLSCARQGTGRGPLTGGCWGRQGDLHGEAREAARVLRRSAARSWHARRGETWVDDGTAGGVCGGAGGISGGRAGRVPAALRGVLRGRPQQCILGLGGRDPGSWPRPDKA